MPRSGRSRVPGTKSTTSYRKPVCSHGHDPEHMIREPEGWVCRICVDEFIAQRRGRRSRGGVLLPFGTSSEKHPSILELLPNRQERRRLR